MDSIQHHGLAEWQPPSPKSTPHSAKFNSYQFLSPPSSGPSPSFDNTWMTPSGFSFSSAFPTPTMSVAGQMEAPSSASSLKRPRPISYQNIDATGQIIQYNVAPIMQPTSATSSFPSHSFIEQFHGTHIEDPTQVGQSAQGPSQGQMQTPPPTRKTSGKDNETPPTIISRRMSDHGKWSKHSGSQSSIDTTSFSFTPLHITPPEPMSFPSGPLTAPVYPHSQLFWDPASSFDVSHLALTTPVDDSFLGTNHYANNAFSYQLPLEYQPPSTTNHVFAVPALPRRVPSRPQSARPAESARSGIPSATSSLHTRQPSTLDPSMLVTAQLADPEAFIQTDPTAGLGTAEGRQPYQYQLEALQREKESRLRKAIRRQGTVDSAVIGSAGLDLRRSLTENRAKKAMSVPQAGSLMPVMSSVHAPAGEQISRAGTPTKKQRPTTQQQPTISPLKNIVPGSVVLTIDERGHATTSIRPKDEKPLRLRRSSASLNVSSGSDSSDSDDLPLPQSGSRRGSSALNSKRPSGRSSPPGSEAQDALRELVNAKKQSSLNPRAHWPGPVAHMPVVPAAYGYYTGEQPAWDISPTTVSDPSLQTPPQDRDTNLFSGTRCICNNSINDEGQLMIQCESCFKWQHVACLGLTRDTIPPHFYCVYCTGMAAPLRSTGRVRAYTTPAGAAYYAPIQTQTFI